MDMVYKPKMQGAYLAPNASVIGDVVLESDVNVWYGAVIRGDSGSIRVGVGTNIQDNCVLHEEVTIGKNFFEDETPEEIMEDAKERINQEKELAMRELRNEVAKMSLAIAEKVVRKDLASDEAQKDLVDKLVDQL